MVAKKTQQKDVLSDYIERLLAIEGEGQRALDGDDLKRVAKELGLSDEDLARVDQAVDDHLTRGQNFLTRGLVDEAVEEIHQAAVLRPFDKDIATQLARAYLGQFQQSGDREARAQAQRSARRAIEIDSSYQPAFDVLAECARPPGGSKRTVVALAAVALVGGGAAIAWFGQGSDNAEDSGATSSIVATGQTSDPTHAGAPIATPVEDRAAALVANKPQVEIPLALVDDKQTGLTLNVQRSRLNRYSGKSFSYEILGTITAGPRELRLLQVRLELRSSGGDVLHTEFTKLHDEHKPEIRPNESLPVRILVFEKRPAPAVASAHLVVEMAEDTPAAETYAKDPAIELKWPGPAPAHIDLRVGERKNEVKTLFDKRSHWLTMSVTNRGKRPVRDLRVAIVIRGKDGTELNRDESFLVLSVGAALPPGQTWIVRTITDVGPLKARKGKGYAGYEVHVVSFD